jgi:hypothetical protein
LITTTPRLADVQKGMSRYSRVNCIVVFCECRLPFLENVSLQYIYIYIYI